MFNTMKKITLAATVSTIAFAGFAGASGMPDISKVEVEASFKAAEDTNALTMFPGIAEDVRNAIAQKVPLTGDDTDKMIRVEIHKVALDGDTLIPDSKEFNQLEGVVAVETVDGKETQLFPLKVSAMSADSTALPGFVAIPPSVDNFYEAMVEGFAAKAVMGVDVLIN